MSRHPEYKLPDMSRELSRLWHQVSENDRKKFQNMAEKARV
jgi:hypothetical protein